MNTSNAVRATRIEPTDSLDDFPTPPWATRALIEHALLPHVPGLMKLLRFHIATDPAANRGYMVKPLREYFGTVVASDIKDYGAGYLVRDYLDGGPLPQAQWTITNPPFIKGPDFLFRSLKTPGWMGTALLVRTQFLEGERRYNAIFSESPPTIYAQFVERVVIHKGVLRDPDLKYWNEETQDWRKPSTATSYCWLVWAKGMAPLPPVWIPPCRKQLTRPGDYPAIAKENTND